jgi:N-methylhydantoinase B/oxoprolinase/acetone carboxylase alpha subunit
MSEILVVVSKIKKMVKEQGLRTGEDFVEELSKKVEEMVKKAVEKVKQEGKKKTLGVEDLM